MKKEFIPYKESLELKELGFDEPCCKYVYVGDTGTNLDHYLEVEPSKAKNWNADALCISQPTFSQAFRWFREKHNLFHEIQIDRTAEPKFCFDIFQYEHFGNYEEIRIGEWYLYRTQEEAELECLRKLIEIVKNGK